MRRRIAAIGRVFERARWGLSAVLVAGLLTAALGWMVVDRASILRHGQRIELRPQPVDPRDLFRGDYVILTYEISRLGPAFWERAAEIKEATGGDIWVRIARAPAPGPGEPLWRVAALHAAPPEMGRGRDTLVLRGRLSGGAARVDYGIERYYVPEGEGLALEALIGETPRDGAPTPIAVEVAVDRAGRAAISALSVRGEWVYEEPWY